MSLPPPDTPDRSPAVRDTNRRQLTKLGVTAVGGVYLRLASRWLPGSSRIGPLGTLGSAGRGAAAQPFLKQALAIGGLGTAAGSVEAKSDSPTAAVLAPRQTRLKLVIEPQGWGSATTPDIEAVLQSVASVMLSHAPDLLLRPLRIRHASDLPQHVCGSLRGSGEQVIHLAVQETRWAQFAYQFAHEFFHELSNAGYICFVGARDPHRWLEESIAEVASLFALRRMAALWRDSPPYPNWRSYSAHLDAYADALLNAPNRQLASGVSFVQWFHERLPQLIQNGWDRQANGLIANQWLPLFERNPSAWEAVTWLNKRPQPPTVAALLEEWKAQAPRQHRAFIQKLGSTLGLSLR